MCSVGVVFESVLWIVVCGVYVLTYLCLVIFAMIVMNILIDGVMQLG